MDTLGRKTLSHTAPSWVDPDASNYFVTVCCKRRGTNQLCLPDVGGALLDTARYYVKQRQWFTSVFLLMPDHVHMVVSFGRGQEVGKLMASWKRFTATKYGIEWQQGFFEHRLRADESEKDKTLYILRNPLRAGLVKEESEWRYVLVLNRFGEEAATDASKPPCAPKPPSADDLP